MLLGISPWINKNNQVFTVAQITRLLQQKKMFRIPDNISEDMKDFLKLVLHEDPLKRPSCSRLLEHSFLLAEKDQPQSRAGFEDYNPTRPSLYSQQLEKYMIDGNNQTRIRNITIGSNTVHQQLLQQQQQQLNQHEELSQLFLSKRSASFQIQIQRETSQLIQQDAAQLGGAPGISLQGSVLERRDYPPSCEELLSQLSPPSRA